KIPQSSRGCPIPGSVQGQKPNCDYAVGLMKALELAMVQWKTMLRYFEELYALSVENADPHSASTIKKQFIGPKIQKIKLMGDLLTNLLRQTCPEGEAGSRTQETQCSITPPALHSIPSSSAESQLKI
uniref:Uncharacterized protein n=1 Tax=Zosterops lateralis melanops TaxID=1220523 RepID=A0A8D2QRM9_ZOSLA